MSHARALVLLQMARGKTATKVALETGYSRPAISRYLSGDYGAQVGKIEAAILKAYDRRICPHDGEEKQPAHCRRIALRPRPYGFPDAESLWQSCQVCPHKPEPIAIPEPQPKRSAPPPKPEKPRKPRTPRKPTTMETRHE